MSLLKKFILSLRLAFYFLLDSLVLLVPVDKRDAAVILRLDAIGDFVIWLQSGAYDIIKNLKNKHDHLIIIANNSFLDLITELNIADNIVSFDSMRFMRNPIYRIMKLYQIRRLGCIAVVQPRSSRVFLQEDEIVRVISTKNKVGSDSDLVNMNKFIRLIGNSFYSKVIPCSKVHGVHQLNRNRAFTELFCGLTGETIKPIKAIFKPSNKISNNYAVIAPGASWSRRRWPVSNFIEIAEDLYLKHKLTTILVGSPGELDIGFEIENGCRAPIINLIGKQSLAESVATISNAKIIIANESGPLHIGAWLGIPSVGIVGGGHYEWFAPYPQCEKAFGRVKIVEHKMPCFGCNWSCIFAKSANAVPCIENITVIQVSNAVNALLN